MRWRLSLAWKVEVSESAAKELKKIGSSNASRIIKYLRKLESTPNPREQGKSLKGALRELWRYRVGDYRILCEIKENELIILTLKIGHRKDIYR